jgi:hypothetical protein
MDAAALTVCQYQCVAWHFLFKNIGCDPRKILFGWKKIPGGEMGRRAVIVAATNRVEAISVSGREVSPLPSRITKCISVHVWCTESRRKWRGWW